VVLNAFKWRNTTAKLCRMPIKGVVLLLVCWAPFGPTFAFTASKLQHSDGSGTCVLDGNVPKVSSLEQLNASIASVSSALMDTDNNQFIQLESHVLQLSHLEVGELLEAVEAALIAATSRGRALLLRIFVDYLPFPNSTEFARRETTGSIDIEWDTSVWLTVYQAINLLSTRYDADRRLAVIELGFVGPFGIPNSEQDASAIHRLLAIHAQVWQHTTFAIPAVVLPMLTADERHRWNTNNTFIRIAPHEWRLLSNNALPSASILLDGSTLNMTALIHAAKALQPQVVLVSEVEVNRLPVALSPANFSISINQTHACVTFNMQGLLDVDIPLTESVMQRIRSASERLSENSTCSSHHITDVDVVSACQRLANHSWNITVVNRSSEASARLSIVSANMEPVANAMQWDRTTTYAFVAVLVCGLIVLGAFRTGNSQGKDHAHSPSGQLVAEPIKLSTTPCRPVRVSRRHTPSRRRSTTSTSAAGSPHR
jgi:hypothetical protein